MLQSLRNSVSWVAFGAAVLAGGQTAAQTGSAEVSELVVTAQRVEENIQQVPIAVSAYTAAALERQSIETLQDIAIRTPGFSAGQVDPIQSNFAIRGIGSPFGISQNAGGDASVPLPWIGWTPFTYPFNLSGQPAISIPCGFTAGGIPVGLQIVGPWGQDDLVLAVARSFEACLAEATPRLPPLVMQALKATDGKLGKK